jgi:hypothetical protein
VAADSGRLVALTRVCDQEVAGVAKHAVALAVTMGCAQLLAISAPCPLARILIANTGFSAPHDTSSSEFTHLRLSASSRLTRSIERVKLRRKGNEDLPQPPDRVD